MLEFLIGSIYKNFIRRILFLVEPERTHDFFVRLGGFSFISWLVSFFSYKDGSLEQNVLGMNFSNPVGLSAGFDKNGDLVKTIEALGFGFMEVGTITDKPYKGNPKPRLYRLPKVRGILVNYGLKNIGVDRILDKLKKQRTKNLILGISIGKTNSEETVETGEGIKDYISCFKKVIESGEGDFYDINISCPNTFSGEPFTEKDKLDKLLREINEIKTAKPIFIKMPVNLEWRYFRELLAVAVKNGIQGVIISNLSKDRSQIKDYIPAGYKGGISGKLVYDLSNDLISRTYREYGDKLIIVGVGGIFRAEEAYEKIKRGASLVELVTGMIYEGPQLIGEINRGLVRLLKADGYNHISEAIGKGN